MQGFLLQPWTTVHCTAGSGLVFSLTQDEEEWLDLGSYADAAFWIDVADVALPSGSSPTPQITLSLQTAPTKDEPYFQPIAGPVILGSTSPSTTPILVKSVRGTSTVPLARWVRWQLSVPSSATGSWGITFRIRAVPAKQSFFAPAQLPGCMLWLRADLGVTLDTTGTGNVQQWNDQSPIGDPNKNLTQATSANRPGYKPSNASYNNLPTLTLASASSLSMASGLWATVVNQPTTWVFVAHNTGSHAVFEYLMDGNNLNEAQACGLNVTPAVFIYASATYLNYTNAWSSPSVVLGEWNGASSNIYFNNITGAAQQSGSVGTGASSGQGGMTLGAHFGAGNYWDGSVAEIIGFSGLLTAKQKFQLRQYLNGRYALSLT